MQQTFATNELISTCASNRSASPFKVLGILASEYVALMESERQILDVRVRELEAKMVMGAQIYDESK